MIHVVAPFLAYALLGGFLGVLTLGALLANVHAVPTRAQPACNHGSLAVCVHADIVAGRARVTRVHFKCPACGWIHDSGDIDWRPE